MSLMHCNFLINDQGATAADVEQLGELVRGARPREQQNYARVGSQAHQHSGGTRWEVAAQGIHRSARLLS